MAPLDTMMTSRPSRDQVRQLPAPFADGLLVQPTTIIGDQAGAAL